MDIRELEDFKLSDAVKFHDELNPALWDGDKLRPEVKDQLIKIADDFLQELGISGLKVKDITISGSNAAFTYTPHSDLDLHILVDFNDLPNDEVYQELFTAKKSLYNDSHEIKVHGVPVELYVQDSNKPVVSIGEYSLKSNDWLKYPSKRKANFNQSATRAKYEKLGNMIELALQSDDIDQIDKVTKIIKQYRQAGLDKHGEFGSENLAFKALRNMGMIKKLYNHKNEIHSKKLSIESTMDEDWHPNDTPPGPEFPPTMPKGTVRVDVSDVYDWYKLGQHISNMKGLGKHDFGKGPPSTILSFGDEDLEHQYIQALKKTGLDTTDIDPKAHDMKKDQKVDPTYNVNEILDKKSAAKVYWSEENYMTDMPFSQMYTTHTAAAQDKNKNILKYNFYDFPKHDLTAIEFSRAVGPWGDNFGIDNAGDQYTVFATLVKTIEEYLSEHKPKFISFGAKEPSRAKLYQTFINRFASKFGYKQINPDNIPKPVQSILFNRGDTPFLLQKVGSEEVNEEESPSMESKAEAVRKIQKFLNKKYNANLDVDGVLGPLTLQSINKFMPQAKKSGAPNPDKTTAVQGKQVKEVLDTEPGKTNKAKWDFSDPDMQELNFTASNGQQYRLDFLAPYIGPDEINQYNLLPDASDKYLDRGFFVQFEQVNKRSPWKKGKQGIEGTGAAAEIFGIVSNAILQFVKKKKPTYLYFQAAESNRISLYSAMVERLLPKLPGWKSQGPSSDGVFTLYSPIKKVTKEASGYIPSEKEKNDPRFKTALTVDVKPDSIKKNAKAFGWKVSREGKPPLLRK